MASIQDDRGYNQGFKPSRALDVRTARRTDYILKKAALPPGSARVLELGCGTGQMSFDLARASSAHVLGTDLCQPFIEEARRKYPHPNLKYEIVDFKQKVEIGRFDAVVGNGILHHLYHDLDLALTQIRGLLEPGGRIVFLEPNLFNPYVFLIFSLGPLRRLARLEPDEMAFTRAFIREKLEKNGFTQIEVEYKDFLLPNTPDALIDPVIRLGGLLEKTPILRRFAQSLFISARASS
jgi:2-polyprenyl-3-methyl-5-hydroxy-6-metoxy-1,4-benzoquinol methylase